MDKIVLEPIHEFAPHMMVKQIVFNLTASGPSVENAFSMRTFLNWVFSSTFYVPGAVDATDLVLVLLELRESKKGYSMV